MQCAYLSGQLWNHRAVLLCMISVWHEGLNLGAVALVCESCLEARSCVHLERAHIIRGDALGKTSRCADGDL